MTTETTAEPITVLPREQRAYEGSPLHTAWCPTCCERTLPGSRGQCMWCDTRLGREADDG